MNINGWYFDNTVDTIPNLPKSIKKLGCSFNNDTVIPSSVTDLDIYYNTKKIRKGFIPDSVTRLKLDNNFDHSTIGRSYLTQSNQEFYSIVADADNQDENQHGNDDDEMDDEEEEELDDDEEEEGGEDEDEEDNEEEEEEEKEEYNDEAELLTLNLKDIMPPNVKVLELFNLKYGACNIVTPSVEVLRIQDSNFKISKKAFEGLPSTIKRIVLPKKSFQFKLKEIPDFLSDRLDGKYQIYKENVPVSEKTTHLIINTPTVLTEGLIPNNVNTITFGHSFNQPIPYLPSSITNISFGFQFNQDLSTVYLPPNLKYLSFDMNFDKSLENLPHGLKFLYIKTLNPCSARSLGSIPSSVDHLSIQMFYGLSDCDEFFDEDDDEEDNNATSASLSANGFAFPTVKMAKAPEVLVIPDHIKFLKLGFRIQHVQLPSSLKTISAIQRAIRFSERRELMMKSSSNIGGNNKTTNSMAAAQSKEKFNESIELHILTSPNFDNVIKPYSLVNNIKSIRFGDGYNQLLKKGSIPNNVETLIFGMDYNQKLSKDTIPPSVTELVLGCSFNKSFEGVLPNTIKKLTVKHGYYHKDMLNWIPSSVEYLELGSNDGLIESNAVFPVEKVPSHITTLILNDEILIAAPSKVPKTVKHLRLCKSKNLDHLPTTLESLTLGEFNDTLDALFEFK